MPENNLLNNLIPSGTLIGQLAIGGGTTDYNDLENKPSINDVTLSGNKTTADLGLFSGSYNDLTDRPTLATVATSGKYSDLSGIPTGSYTLNLGMVTADQSINTTDYEYLNTNFSPLTTSLQAGNYTYVMFINAYWADNSFQFMAGLEADGILKAASNSFAMAQNNSTCIFFGDVSIATTGQHTFKVMAKVSGAGKNVSIMRYTSIMCILIRRT